MYAAFGILMLLVVNATWAFEEPDVSESGVGLRGILPELVPLDLLPEEFAILDGNWADWSADVADKVVRLYEGPDLDLEAQKSLVSTLRTKVMVMERALADIRYRSLHDEIDTMHGRLSRRISLAQAVLDTLEMTPESVKSARLQSARQDLAEALDGLESMLNTIRNGGPWLAYMRVGELRGSLQDDALPGDLLQSVQSRIEARDRVESPAQREFMSRPQFVALEKAVGRLIEARQLQPPLNESELRTQLANLVAAVERYEAESLLADAAAIRETSESIGQVAPDGGQRIRAAVQSAYLQPNFQVVASEPLLSRVVYSQQTDQGPVTDFILGANVSGHQWTNSTVGLDVKPSTSGAKFDVTLTGVTQSRTAGVTRQATVYTNGYHRFTAAIEVFFDGHAFEKGPGRISVDANNQTTGARTGLSGFPIFGSIAEGVAMREARRQRFQSEAIARQRVSDRVLPDFDQELDVQLFDANERFQNDLNQRLEEAGLSPVERTVHSNDFNVYLSSKVREGVELAGSPSHLVATSQNGMVIRVHESLLNNMFDRMNFAGRTMTDDEIGDEVERFFSLLAGREVNLVGDESGQPRDYEDTPSYLVFAEKDPIRFQVEEGRVNLVIRAGIQQEGREDVPTQVVTVPVTMTLEGDKLKLQREEVRVAPAPGTEGGGRQIIRAGVMRNKIQDSLPNRERSRAIHIKRTDKDDLVLYITRIKARNGWLTFWAE